jgi:hypothetical protein
MPEKSNKEVEVILKNLLVQCVDHKGAYTVEKLHNIA